MLRPWKCSHARVWNAFAPPPQFQGVRLPARRDWCKRSSTKSNSESLNKRRRSTRRLKATSPMPLAGRGKRLRPLVALLAGGATGAINSEHVDLAVIVELIHIATLVQDDVMDEAERGRGKPTVHARWGNSLSVLLGDCLFAHALTLSTHFENSEISRAIARTASEICSGEMIQTQRRFDLKLGVDDYLRIVKMKTGSLFAAAAELGGLISEADP